MLQLPHRLFRARRCAGRSATGVRRDERRKQAADRELPWVQLGGSRGKTASEVDEVHILLPPGLHVVAPCVRGKEVQVPRRHLLVCQEQGAGRRGEERSGVKGEERRRGGGKTGEEEARRRKGGGRREEIGGREADKNPVVRIGDDDSHV
eukprot:70936-Hanusia_phi.AAC.4